MCFDVALFLCWPCYSQLQVCRLALLLPAISAPQSFMSDQCDMDWWGSMNKLITCTSLNYSNPFCEDDM